MFLDIPFIFEVSYTGHHLQELYKFDLIILSKPVIIFIRNSHFAHTESTCCFGWFKLNLSVVYEQADCSGTTHNSFTALSFHFIIVQLMESVIVSFENFIYWNCPQLKVSKALPVHLCVVVR